MFQKTIWYPCFPTKPVRDLFSLCCFCVLINGKSPNTMTCHSRPVTGGQKMPGTVFLLTGALPPNIQLPSVGDQNIHQEFPIPSFSTATLSASQTHGAGFDPSYLSITTFSMFFFLSNKLKYSTTLRHFTLTSSIDISLEHALTVQGFIWCIKTNTPDPLSSYSSQWSRISFGVLYPLWDPLD